MSERPSALGELPGDGAVLTTAEYLRTAESVRVQELLYGTLHVAESPSPMHQQLLFDLAVLLKVFVTKNRLGTIWIAPLDIILTRHGRSLSNPTCSSSQNSASIS